jgi:glycosyltransferase involved in cell wall biosynthesis
MIVRDEELTIARCLNCIKDVVDEIIIVDTGSTDKTKDIISNYTRDIYDFKWIDDFSAARNYAFSKATKDYILWLDADDVLLLDDIDKLKSLKQTLKADVDSVTMKYNIGIDEYGNPASSYRRNRLVKRSRNFMWRGFIHEYLEVYGNIINSDISVTHQKVKATPNRNIEIYEAKLKEGFKLIPRDILYYAHELYDHGRFEEALINYNNFLDSGLGWYEDNIRVCGNISDYYQSTSNFQKSREYSFKSFQYDLPRAEACCRLGFSYLCENKIDQAIFWYELATELKKPENSLGFFNEASWTWLPHIQLCVCYDRIGDHITAFKHNEIAYSYIPNDEKVLYNKNYFQSIGITS